MIKFGTDGWRAIIAEDFTIANVEIVSQAVADYILKHNKAEAGFVVGYDNRFMSEKFARVAAEVLAANRINVLLCKLAVPTPLVSFAVVHHQTFGGVMITASHNPYDYNGYKLKMDCGASSSPEMTAEVEALLANVTQIKKNYEPVFIREIDPKPAYIEHVRNLVDMTTIRQAGFEIIVDNLYGSGAHYLTDILQGTGINVTEINDQRDPLFGGVNPEPLAVNTPQLIATMKAQQRWHLGIVLDGDADRLALVDSTGQFLTAQEVFVLLLEYLFKIRGQMGAVAKAFNMTRMLDKLSPEYGFELIETKIGFKYLAPYLIDKSVILAGEESGGYGTTFHLPERDGVFNALLIIELLAKTGLKPEQLLQKIKKQTGDYYYHRIDIHTQDHAAKDRVMNHLRQNNGFLFGGIATKEKKEFDGIKFFLENDGWILFRTSGTENLLRVYAEGRSPKNLQDILDDGLRIIQQQGNPKT